MRVDSPGLVFVVGAGGAGKSSLLSALAGDDRKGAPAVRGTVELDGCGIGTDRLTVAWLPQHTRLRPEANVDEQLASDYAVDSRIAACWLREAGGDAASLDRPAGMLSPSLSRLLPRLAILSRPASLYLLDEPTADLDSAHADLLRGRMAGLARHAMVVVATHNRQDCLALGGHTALLAGGTIQECAPTAGFFTSPATPAGRVYVQTGYCNLAPPRAPEAAVDGIWWIQPRLLCGMSRPGLVSDAERQYRHLADGGIHTLVCMEERRAYPLEPLRRSGLHFHHVPVPDMVPPSFDQAVALCRLAEPLIGEDRGVAVHCRGGLGRTGTGLAAILAWLGDEPDQAIARVRAARPWAIQTAAQLRFVHDFAGRIRGWH